VSGKFTWTLDEIVLPQCVYCRHAATIGDLPVCAAFPGLIPDAIRQNQVDHRKPYLDPDTGEPADVGIRGNTSITFEPADGVSPAALDALYRRLDALGGAIQPDRTDA
jgi:hypothetical protein